MLDNKTMTMIVIIRFIESKIPKDNQLISGIIPSLEMNKEVANKIMKKVLKLFI